MIKGIFEWYEKQISINSSNAFTQWMMTGFWNLTAKSNWKINTFFWSSKSTLITLSKPHSPIAKQLIDQGFYLSLNSSIFKKDDFDFSIIPSEKLFLETDDNDMVSIKDVYKMASLHLKIAEEQLKEKIYINFTTLFSDYGR